MRSILAPAARLAAGALAATVLATAAPGAPAAAEQAVHSGHSGKSRSAAASHALSVRVHRGGRDRTVAFRRGRAGEVFLSVAVSARGVSWADAGNESAVVSAYVDGRYATDIVITSSAPVTRQFALGRLRAGRHTLRLHYATRRSPSDAGVARLQHIGFKTVAPTSPAYVAAKFAPVLYGRNLADLGGRFESNHTDTPLLAWHRELPAATPGHTVIEYSVLWSNEDGGTDTPGLMAQWGRTTDIEWVYRVEVDARGRRVPGTGVYQAPAHQTAKFAGRYAGTHPLIETCTANNNVCDTVDDPMRFALSTREVLPAGQPREHEMDVHPWTYQVMAREMVREGKIESPSDPATLAVGDQRSYLYVAVDHDADPAASTSGVGLAVDIRLKGDATTYTSDHEAYDDFGAYRTINRDGPAATTVELPRGTTAADIASISVRRVPVGVTDNGASLSVTALDRAFLLDQAYLPGTSFAQWRGSVTLTADAPSAVLWQAS